MRVVLRALAADPNERYATANDFARDLSRVISQLPPITYQDLAAIVADAANARARRRKAENKDQSGVLGDVIIDALHEFSRMESLLPPEQRFETPPARVKEEGFVNPSEWGLDDGLGDFLSEKEEQKPVAQVPPRKPPPPKRRPSPPSAASRRPTPKPAPEDGPWWKKWWG
jgi:hypothetical protein